MLFKSQRGAMFGLDARIALAIVGGMSAITGVSMMQSSVGARAGALEQELSNVSQIISNAQEQWGHSPLFFIKASHKMPTLTDHEEAKNIAYSFMDDSVFQNRPPQWVGPYFSKMKSSITGNKGTVTSMSYGTLAFTPRTTSNGTSDTTVIPQFCSVAPRDCYYWITLLEVPIAISRHLDKTLDDDNQRQGKVRYTTESGGNSYLFYQGPRVLL